MAARGEVRNQFHHVIDVAPTVLEAAGLPEPREVNGVPQRPMDGVSMVYSFDDAEAWDLDFWQSQTPEQRLSAPPRLTRRRAP